MAQVTKNQRAQIISEMVREANKQPPSEKHPVERIPGIKGAAVNCDVIPFSADQLLLNPHSHRVKAELVDDPAWIGTPEKPGLISDPYGDGAQMLIADYIRKSKHYSELKVSLQNDGQQQNAIITHEGVLINGNTRAVAMREMNDPQKRYIRVAVLPQHIDSGDLNMLELRLQMQRELKSTYSLINGLLFLEDLVNAKMPYEQINLELRLDLDNIKKGIAEVKARLESLDFIRFLQKRDTNNLRLTVFDTLSHELLREVQSRYNEMTTSGKNSAAERYLDTVILSMLTGTTAVHKIRAIDDSFLANYMVPNFEDDEELGMFAPQLFSAQPNDAPIPAGTNKLAPRRNDAATDGPQVNIKKLIAIAAQPTKSHTFEQDGKRVSLDNARFIRAFDDAISDGIKAKKRTARAEDKLSAPLESIREATQRLQEFLENHSIVANNSQFDKGRRQRITHAFRALKKRFREVEEVIAKSEV